MKTHVVQLDRHDDTTSVIDKIHGSKANRILLVWPRRGRVLTELLDLHLVQRASQNIGAQLACVADDDDVLDHAMELGIPVFRSTRTAEKIPWRRIRKKKSFEPHGLHPLIYFQERKMGLKSTRPLWMENKRIRWLFFSLGIIAVFGLLLFLVPGATVKLTLAVDVQSVNLQVWASPELQTMNLSGGIPATFVNTVVEGQKSIQTTGSMVLPDQTSSGEVTFTNLTDQSVLIPAGTVVQNTREPIIQFRTLRAVVLKSNPGSQVDVGVQAVQAGSQGNIRSEEIKAVVGTLGTKVSVINHSLMTGGRNIPSPTASKSDLDQLREEIIQELQASALQRFKDEQITNTVLLPETLKMVKIQDEVVEPAFGLPAEQVEMSLRVEFQAWTFNQADLETIAHAALDATLDSDMNPVRGSFEIVDIQPQSFENNQVRWQIRASQFIQNAWDSSQLIKETAGKTVSTAINNLAGFPGLISRPQITLNPTWWPVLPLLPARIEVEVR